MRTVTLNIDQEKVFDVRERCPKEFSQALGYLAGWAIDLYDTVSIVDDREPGDLAAYYTHSENDKRYVIGAVWHPEESRYSFHS